MGFGPANVVEADAEDLLFGAREYQKSARDHVSDSGQRCIKNRCSIDRATGRFGLAEPKLAFPDLSAVALSTSIVRASGKLKTETLRLKGDVGIGPRAERVVVITRGLVLAPISIWCLVGAIALLTATAWITGLQRILFVRKQLVARE